MKLQVMVTKNKELLLGASYFDLSHCGYIETKDLEDIFVPLQLDLSRAEIKKLVSKLANKDQVDEILLMLFTGNSGELPITNRRRERRGGESQPMWS